MHSMRRQAVALYGTFPTRTLALMSRRAPDRFLTSVLMTDVVGSTEMAAELGDRGWRDLVQLHNSLVRAALRRHDGREMDTAGDGFFAIFDAPGSAILCALEIVAAVQAIGVQVRAGVHVGEVEQLGRKVGGITVPIAARIASAAAPHEVLASATVRDLAAGADLEYEDRGVHQLKGVPGEWRLYAVTRPGGVTTAAVNGGTHAAERRYAAVRRARARPMWQRHPRAAAATAAGLMVVIGAAALLVWSPWRPQALAGVSPNMVGIIDPARNEIIGEVEVGQQPVAIAQGAGGVWTVNAIDATVQRIDPSSQLVVHTVDVGIAPTSLVVADGSVWVANSGGRTVSRINAEAGRVVDTIEVGTSPSAIAAGADGIWVTNRGDGTLVRLDPSTGDPAETFRVGLAPSGLAVDGANVWVISEQEGTLVHLDPATGWLSTPLPVGPRPIAVAIGAGAVWIASATDGTITRVDATTQRITSVVPLGGTLSALLVRGDTVWVAALDGLIHQLEAADAAAPPVTIVTGGGVSALAPVDEGMWFTAVASTGAQHGGTLRIASDLGLPVTEPGFGAPNELIWSLMGDGLVAYPRRGGSAGTQLFPGLAVSMPSVTDDGLTYIFRLRPGLAYSNGHPVRPEDFRYSIERGYQVEDPFGGGPLADPSLFAALRGAEACAEPPVPRCDLSAGIVTDAAAGTITFHLTQPDPDFVSNLAHQYPLPESAAPPDAIAVEPVPSTGPYMVAELTETHMRLVRNPHFESWSPADRPDGFVDEIVFVSPETRAEATLMVQRGEADWVQPFVDTALIPSLRTQSPAQLYFNPSVQTTVFVDTTQPPFDVLAARQALNLALDRGLFTEMRGGAFAASPNCQLVPPTSSGYQPYCPWTEAPTPGGQWSAPDLEAAQRLIDESGTRGMPIVVGPVTPRFNEDVAPYLVTLLEELGFEASLKTVATTEEAETALVEGRLQVSVWGLTVSSPTASAYFTPVMCSFSRGLTNYCDPELDERIAAARDLEVSDPASAAEEYAAIERDVIDLALVVPATYDGTTFVSSRVRGVEHNFAGWLLLDRVWIEDTTS
jgi:ABC-type transport system substrate-binding protein/class 3 adenylate cyclase